MTNRDAIARILRSRRESGLLPRGDAHDREELAELQRLYTLPPADPYRQDGPGPAEGCDCGECLFCNQPARR